jgi:hypothetical protein
MTTVAAVGGFGYICYLFGAASHGAKPTKTVVSFGHEIMESQGHDLYIKVCQSITIGAGAGIGVTSLIDAVNRQSGSG